MHQSEKVAKSSDSATFAVEDPGRLKEGTQHRSDQGTEKKHE
jgi:hypothetical protein